LSSPAIPALETFLLTTGAYRPPSWGQQAPVYSLTCTLPASSPNASSNNQNATNTGGTQSPTTFFFDAMFRAEHVQEAIGTRHPVQVGPAIVDHIYLNPSRVVLEVGYSDSMQSYQSGQYSSSTSRSVAAYQTLKQIQAARVPITLSTRLTSYTNMWLADVRAVEDNRTKASARISLYFEQIISAQVNNTPTSTRPSTTNTTNEGTKSPTSVPTSISSEIAGDP
jgi:hypothetical protein